jgi:copper chaperone CopZ
MSSTVTTTLPITGMTCGHCVQAVTVTSSAPLDDAAVRAAIDEAGYDVAR